ncbi:hypothetical protein, partial [Siminovitchia fortis]|uniref:hypothetical protein n=1 Tax=Siminovitchia fortis TaxID=254758 RepID=UPI001C92D258
RGDFRWVVNIIGDVIFGMGNDFVERGSVLFFDGGEVGVGVVLGGRGGDWGWNGCEWGEG